MNKTAFGKELRNRGFTSRRGTGGVHLWTGISLKVTGSDTFAYSPRETNLLYGLTNNVSLPVTEAEKNEFDDDFGGM